MPPHPPKALLKMTILIDSFRPNYDLSAVGMRWMKSWCNWGIGLKPCWRSWRRPDLCVFTVYVCMRVYLCVCSLGADGFWVSVPDTDSVNLCYWPQKYRCPSCSRDASGQYLTAGCVGQARSSVCPSSSPFLSLFLLLTGLDSLIISLNRIILRGRDICSVYLVLVLYRSVFPGLSSFFSFFHTFL